MKKTPHDTGAWLEPTQSYNRTIGDIQNLMHTLLQRKFWLEKKNASTVCGIFPSKRKLKFQAHNAGNDVEWLFLTL